MADIKQALYEYLAATSGITSLVSTRIYPVLAPQGGSLPYVVMTQVSSEHIRHTTGRAQVARTRMQFDAYAGTSPAVQSVADALRVALDMYTGTMGATAQVVVQRVFLESMRDLFIAPADASEQGPFRMSLDFMIWHAES